jgi:hypothetical protein
LGFWSFGVLEFAVFECASFKGVLKFLEFLEFWFFSGFAILEFGSFKVLEHWSCRVWKF